MLTAPIRSKHYYYYHHFTHSLATSIVCLFKRYTRFTLLIFSAFLAVSNGSAPGRVRPYVQTADPLTHSDGVNQGFRCSCNSGSSNSISISTSSKNLLKRVLLLSLLTLIINTHKTNTI